MTQENKTVDISSRKVVTMRDVQDAASAGASRLVTAPNCVLTPSARDFLQQRNIQIVSGSAAPPASRNGAAPAAKNGQRCACARRAPPIPGCFPRPKPKRSRKKSAP